MYYGGVQRDVKAHEMLTQENLVAYLLRRGLIDVEAIVGSDLEILDVSRRNRNFKVLSRRGPSYLLKQGIGPDGMRTVAHEAHILRGIDAIDAGALRRCVPRCVDYDADEQVLITQLFPDAQSLHQYYARRRRFSCPLARAMGRALAALHALPPDLWPPPYAFGPVEGAHWVLSIDRPVLAVMRDISAANLQLIRIVQQFPEFCDLLGTLRKDWEPAAQIHGDIKWDNCLVELPDTSAPPRAIKIVDWELAGPGDPCWDAGSVFSNYLSFWLFSIPVTGETPPDRFMDLARFPLQHMQPAMRAFWQAYIAGRGLPAAATARTLQRATRFAAARLLLTAFEQMQTAQALTGPIICALQLCLNILQRPDDAGRQLLGIDSIVKVPA